MFFVGFKAVEANQKDSMRTLVSAMSTKAEVYIEMQTYMMVPQLKFVMYQQGVYKLVSYSESFY